MPARCCGSSRVDGAVYMECGLSKYGKPLEHFIIDSPIFEVDVNGVMFPIMEAFSLTSRGVQVIEKDGVPHIFDVIGAEHYPDVESFFEEVRVLGASRRCELPASEYAKLIPGQSRMLLIHPHATIHNHAEYYSTGSVEMAGCPKALPDHQIEDGTCKAMCARLWNVDLTPSDGDTVVPPSGLKQLTGEVAATSDKLVAVERSPWPKIKRRLPCGHEFYGHYRHRDIEPKYAPALFLSLPITNLALVDPERKFTDKANKLSGSQMSWSVVDE